jgi:hypothetical protein
MQNVEIEKKGHKKIRGKKSKSTRVNLTNPPHATCDRDKNIIPPKEGHNLKGLNKKIL